MTQISRKALPSDSPAPDRLELAAQLFEELGLDVSAFRAAAMNGTDQEKIATLAGLIKEVVQPAPAQTRPMPGIMTQHDAFAQKEAAKYRKIAGQLAVTRPPWSGRL